MQTNCFLYSLDTTTQDNNGTVDAELPFLKGWLAPL